MRMSVPSAKMLDSVLHLMTCLSQVFSTKNAMFLHKKVIFSNDINKDDNDDKERVDEVV